MQKSPCLEGPLVFYFEIYLFEQWLPTSFTGYVKPERKKNFLTLNCLACQIKYVWLKFEFEFKKGQWKNSYERRAYESVNDGSPSWVTSQKWTENKIQTAKG